MRGATRREMLVCAEAAVRFQAHAEILAAEPAGIGTRRQRQRPAHRDCISELERFVTEILLRDEVLRDRPAFEAAAQDQFGFDLMLALAPPFVVGRADAAWAMRAYA